LKDSTLLEADARKQIDEKLGAAGWVIQDNAELNLYQGLSPFARWRQPMVVLFGDVFLHWATPFLNGNGR
jgi:hypothetical protein